MRQTTTIFIITIALILFMIGTLCAAGEDISGSLELLIRGDSLFNADEIDEASKVYTQAAETAGSEGNKSVLTEAYSQIALCYLEAERIDEGRSWLEKARKTASEDDPLGWSRYLDVRGRFEWKDAAALQDLLSPKTEEATSTFKEIYSYCLKHGLYERAVNASEMVSATAPSGRSDRKKARIEWALKGINAAEKGEMEKRLGRLWNNLGWAYDDEGRYKESLEAFKKARVYDYRSGVELSMVNADLSVGHALRMMGKIDSARTVLENAQRWALIVKSEKNNKESSGCLGFAFWELGEIYLAQGDSARALTNFKPAYSNLSSAGFRESDPERLKKLDERMRVLSSRR